MMLFIYLIPTKKHSFIVYKPFKYKDVIVPRGFITNGADVPRLFWWFIPPNQSDYLPAVVLHDFLCSKRQFDKADKYLKEVLELLEIPKWKINIIYYSVRIYTKFIRPLGIFKENIYEYSK